MANIVLRNGWNQPQTYNNVASVTFQTDIEGVTATYYENGSGGSGGLGAQANWVQNDAQAADYIKNRPFYSSYTLLIAPTGLDFKKETVNGKELHGAILGQLNSFIESKYTVIWGEDLWFCDVVELEGTKYLGNTNLLGIPTTTGTQPPFVALCEEGFLTFYTDAALALDVGLGGPEEIHKIDSKYLPENMMAGADWEAGPDEPGFIANKPTTLGLDTEQLQKYLTDNLYVTQGYVTEQLKEVENKIPSVEEFLTETEIDGKIKAAVDEINKVLADYATTKWVGDNYTTKTETTNLSNRIKTIEDSYINKTTFKTLEETVTALQKALADYKNEVAKTYATKTELVDSQADWSIEDESNPAAIKNKPFGDIPDILTNATFTKEDFTTSTDENGVVTFYLDIGQTLDTTKQYTVIWNGVTRTCTPNVNISNSVFQLSSEGIFTATGVEEVTTITLRLTDNVYRVDKKYLPVSEIVSGYATQTYVNNKISEIPAPNWNETDTNSKAYIWNKPTIPAAQVNADWNATSGKAKILNKPTIPPAPEQPDWNETNEKKLSFIQHKPTIPDAQVQSNWAQDDPSKIDFIKGRPEFYSNWDATEGRARIANMPTVFRHSNNTEGTEEVLLDTPEGWTKKIVSKLTMTVTFDDDSVKIYSMVGEEVVE